MVTESTSHVIRLEETDEEFSRAVIKAFGKNLYYCFQCGTCTASCPVARFDENYSPRRIIRSAVLGLSRLVLESDLIWLCAICNSCTERCPRGVRPSEVIRTIRNMATKKGQVHEFYVNQANAIANYGRIWKNEEIVNELRDDMGLPQVAPVSLVEIAKVMDATKVKELLAARDGATEK